MCFSIGQDEIIKGMSICVGKTSFLRVIRSVTQVSKGKLSFKLSNIIEMSLSALKWTTECIG